MRTKVLILVFSLSLASVIHFVPITSVGAIPITYTPFWFFIDEPKTLSHEEMHFTIQNTNDKPTNFSVVFLAPNGIEIDASFTWETITLQPQEFSVNHYDLIVESQFSVTALINIMIYQQTAYSEDPIVSTGASVINYITFYSAEDGAVLDLHIVDQSFKPRECAVDIFYKLNESFSWSPIDSFVGSSYSSVLPLGEYHIRARDLISNRTGETRFSLSGNQEEYVQLTLVGFKMFRVLFRGEQDDQGNVVRIDQIGVETTINNFVGVLYDVEIYAQLFKDSELFLETNKDYREQLDPVTDYEADFWFPQQYYPSGNYTIKGMIDSAGLNIAEQITIIGSYTAPSAPIVTIENMVFVAALGLTLVNIYLLARYYRIRRKDIEQKSH